MQITDKQLASILLENNLATSEILKKAADLASLEKISFWEAIVQTEVISDEHLGQLAADFLRLPFVNLAKTTINPQVLNIVPEVVSKKQKVISFALDQNGLSLAMTNPENAEIADFVTKKTGYKTNIYFATEKDINDALVLYKKDLQKSFEELLAEQVTVAGQTTTGEAPIAKIVDLLIEYAYHNKASDVHIEPREEESQVRFRIDGILHDVLQLPHNLHDKIISRIKVLSRLRTDEHLSAQDGKMQLKIEDEKIDIRVSIVPILDGEKGELRLLSARARQFSLAELGMTERDLEIVKEGFEKPYGMVLSTGPTGSGKTTTIYSILKILNTRDKNIATIEDPVEYEVEGVNQIQVNPKTNLTFANGLRSILRQDPDIIFVGEVRDEETADIAINSAMTGHLVLSTIHTNDASTTLPRLIDMKIEPFLVASTVNVIIGQRLVRKICEKCKVSQTITFEEIIRYFPPDSIRKHFGDAPEIRVYQGKGCPVCHTTGYHDRIGIFEVLEITDQIRKLITQKADAGAIKRKAVEEGLVTMLDDGLEKIRSGKTTIEEVIRATRE